MPPGAGDLRRLLRDCDSGFDRDERRVAVLRRTGPVAAASSSDTSDSSESFFVMGLLAAGSKADPRLTSGPTGRRCCFLVFTYFNVDLLISYFGVETRQFSESSVNRRRAISTYLKARSGLLWPSIALEGRCERDRVASDGVSGLIEDKLEPPLTDRFVEITPGPHATSPNFLGFTARPGN
jgi:hypothetical protein